MQYLASFRSVLSQNSRPKGKLNIRLSRLQKLFSKIRFFLFHTAYILNKVPVIWSCDPQIICSKHPTRAKEISLFDKNELQVWAIPLFTFLDILLPEPLLNMNQIMPFWHCNQSTHPLETLCAYIRKIWLENWILKFSTLVFQWLLSQLRPQAKPPLFTATCRWGL